MENYDENATVYSPGIGKEQVIKATEILNSYKRAKANLERRIVENEEWWKMRHWELIRKKHTDDPEPASAWLFNSISNKHADVMDNYPEPGILPRNRDDIEAAKILSDIVPAVLEYNRFEETYSDVWWYKLKNGTGCYGVFWNSSLCSGLGDIDIRGIDILNVFWEPGIKDIQNSRNLFTVELVDTDILEGLYPDLKGTLDTKVDIARYLYDDGVDTANKSAVVDWYYKKTVDGVQVLHYCKFVGTNVIYASENDPLYQNTGYYNHGKYPFVFDPLFIEEGTPCGFGYIDVMKDVQMYIDKLNQIIIKNALQAGKRRFFISDNTGINEEEFADWSKEFVHVAGNIDDRNIKEISVSQLDSGIVAVLNQKIDELKETSGNRDVSQGGVSGGVTAASAIAALQEAGSKLSRDMIKGSYRAFKSINYLIIELMCQFYDDSRTFRICSPEGGYSFVDFAKNQLAQSWRNKQPVFDIYVTSQKSSPFSKTAQNELAKELYSAGIFDPRYASPALVCLEMMDFEGKNNIMAKVSENSANHQLLQKLTEQNQKLKELVDMAYGSNISQIDPETPLEPSVESSTSKKPRLEDNFQGAARLEAIRKTIG